MIARVIRPTIILAAWALPIPPARPRILAALALLASLAIAPCAPGWSAPHGGAFHGATPHGGAPRNPIPPSARLPARDPQRAARRELHQGTIHRLREIERRVLPTMPHAQYLGPEYDAAAMAYRLKFIENGRVMFVDVDARSGDIIDSRH